VRGVVWVDGWAVVAVRGGATEGGAEAMTHRMTHLS
jgi:hypothetical protein